MTWLAAATNWLNEWGPIAWGVAFFVGCFLATAIYWLFVDIDRRRIINRYAALALERSGVNPLNSTFDRQRVYLPHFFNPYYVSYKGKRFQDCQIWGPSYCYFCGNLTVIGVEFRHCQVVIVKTSQLVFGATAFENAVITGGEMSNITFLMNRETYDSIQNVEFKRYIPVLNA